VRVPVPVVLGDLAMSRERIKRLIELERIKAAVPEADWREHFAAEYARLVDGVPEDRPEDTPDERRGDEAAVH
jgi:hypothetical protein